MSETTIAPNPVTWFEIYVDNMDRARQFYETVFTTRLSSLSDPTDSSLQMQAFPMQPNAPNASGALVKMEEMKPGGNSVIVYFASQDCSVEEARVEGAGGTIVKPKMSIGEYGFVSLCLDTEGNMFGIHSMK